MRLKIMELTLCDAYWVAFQFLPNHFECRLGSLRLSNCPTIQSCLKFRSQHHRRCFHPVTFLWQYAIMFVPQVQDVHTYHGKAQCSGDGYRLVYSSQYSWYSQSSQWVGWGGVEWASKRAREGETIAVTSKINITPLSSSQIKCPMPFFFFFRSQFFPKKNSA